MRNLSRSSGLVALLAVLFFSGRAAGQCPARPEPGEKLVIITLVGGQPRVSADPVQIKQEAETVHWCYADGDPIITFRPKRGDHPFAQEPNHQGKHVRSGVSAPGKRGKFHYAVTVPVPGGAPAVLDPVVEVIP
jgi:hypothetical protein